VCLLIAAYICEDNNISPEDGSRDSCRNVVNIEFSSDEGQCPVLCRKYSVSEEASG
jgi:hypothetical protein